MRRVLEHETREDDRILDRAQAGDGAGAERRAVHDRRIELVLAALVENGAFAGVEERRILEPLDGILDGVERRGAAGEPARSCIEHLGERRANLRLALLGARLLAAGACTALYRESPSAPARRLCAHVGRASALDRSPGHSSSGKNKDSGAYGANGVRRTSNCTVKGSAVHTSCPTVPMLSALTPMGACVAANHCRGSICTEAVPTKSLPNEASKTSSPEQLGLQSRNSSATPGTPRSVVAAALQTASESQSTALTASTRSESAATFGTVTV